MINKPSIDSLILALDIPIDQARSLVRDLGDTVGFYKIGMGALGNLGNDGAINFAQELKQTGKRIFLDLKLFDIGQTVENAVRGLSQIGVDFLTVHGDPHVVRAAIKGRGDTDLKILAVTILTSLDRDDLDNGLIISGDVHELTLERARRALSAGADGVISSPQEAAAIRALPEATGKLIVTPGVRPIGTALGDQKRVATPTDALMAGADHIVVGRPIVKAENPTMAADAIQAEIAAIK